MLQNHLLHGLNAAGFSVSSTGRSIDFFFILAKMFDDDYVFEGLFKKTSNVLMLFGLSRPSESAV